MAQYIEHTLAPRQTINKPKRNKGNKINKIKKKKPHLTMEKHYGRRNKIAPMNNASQTIK